jgi:membrane dipeptidase
MGLTKPYAPSHNRWNPNIEEPENAEVEAARREYAGDPKRLAQQMRQVWARYEARLPTPSYPRIADHIDHAVKLGGVDHVGLGSDFDGVDSVPRGMEDASKLPNLVRGLARRGYSEEDLGKILGGNLLRVMKQVERVAREMPPRK